MLSVLPMSVSEVAIILATSLQSLLRISGAKGLGHSEEVHEITDAYVEIAFPALGRTIRPWGL